MKPELKSDLEGLLRILPLVIELPNNKKTFGEFLSSEVGAHTKVALETFFVGHGYKDINEIHKKLTTVKNEAMDAILDHFPYNTAGYIIAGKVDESLKELGIPTAKVQHYCQTIAERYGQRDKEKNEILNVSSMLGVDPSCLTPKDSGTSGANKGCIFTSPEDGSRHFIKGFSNDARQETGGKLDPNEVLVYKVMEYMGLGPETTFLVRRYSTGRGTATSGNYIMTRDVCTPTYEGEKRGFFLDEAENKEMYLEASKDKGFNVELSALALVNDIMVLGDTFGDNPKNYGVVKSVGSQGTRYSVMMVDHLPNSNNAEFPPRRFVEGEPYSPRTSIQKRIESPRYNRDDIAITKLSQQPAALGEAKKSFSTEAIKDDVNTRVSFLPEALVKAVEDTKRLITENDRSFIDRADERLNSYAEKITLNFNKYQDLEKSQQTGLSK